MSFPTQILAPWQWSPTVMISMTLALALYTRGARRSDPAVPAARRTAFYAGLLVLYGGLQTGWDYYASHLFFVLQLQHFVLHDLGPALLAASAPGTVLAAGLPRIAARAGARIVRGLSGPLRILASPGIAVALYVVSELIWLVPPITFDAMLSNGLYRDMSWSMVFGAMPFWRIILDPRACPPARLRLRYRFLCLYLGMLPMMLFSAALEFSHSDWYPVYRVCGRLLPVSPLTDQELGGLAMWVPGGLLAATVFLFGIGRRLESPAARAAPG